MSDYDGVDRIHELEAELAMLRAHLDPLRHAHDELSNITTLLKANHWNIHQAFCLGLSNHDDFCMQVSKLILGATPDAKTSR